MAQPSQTTHFRNLNGTGQNVTAGTARVSHLTITNAISPAATAFVQFFDLAAADVVLGTTRPILVVHVPAAAAAVNGTLDIDFGHTWLILTRLSVFGTTTAEGSTGTADGVFLQVTVE